MSLINLEVIKIYHAVEKTLNAYCLQKFFQTEIMKF